MIVSRDEAWSFLSKLKTESNVVCVVFWAPSWVFSLFVGSIVTLESDAFIVQQVPPLVLFAISLQHMSSCEYAEVKEFIDAIPEQQRKQAQETLATIQGTIRGIIIFKFQNGNIAILEVIQDAVLPN